MNLNFENAKPHDVESWLRKRLERIELIGQIPLDEGQYFSICKINQQEHKREKKLFIQRVTPAFFVTLMVFTARYSGKNVRNFWEPYANLVWNLEQASQYFQIRCREQFYSSITYLEKNFDLVFPQRTKGDVVRPIYRHAIIPYYLQDDFASWLKDKWKIILDIPQHELVEQLILDNSFRYLPPTLKNFISGEDTKETASNLIITLSTAAEMYAESKDAEEIDLLLRENPIERDLWHELLKEYQEKENRVRSKKHVPTIDWVWNLRENELNLRIQDIFVQGGEEPDRFVWVAQDQDPYQSEIESRIIPWQQEEGWFIDQCIMDRGELNGQLVLFSRSGNILKAYPIPEIPADKPIMFFRPVNNNSFGVPVELSSHIIKEGQWLVSKISNVSFESKKQGKFNLLESLPVPIPLNQLGNHSEAGFFDVEPPFDIYSGKLKLAKFEQQTTRSGKPKIVDYGKSHVQNLSPEVPIAYTKLDISLVLSNAPNHVLNRGTLWIRSSTETITHRLEVLKARESFDLIDGNLYIPLGDLIPKKPALYSMQVRVGLTPIFSAPLKFSYLPGIEVKPPDPNRTYFPEQFPTCRIKGIHATNIKGRLSTKINEVESDEVQITWTDLRDNPQVAIELENERIPLKWEIPRFNVWLTPNKDIYSMEEFRGSTLNALSTVDNLNDFYIQVSESLKKREITLSADGKYSSEVKLDPVVDLLREHPQAVHILEAHMDGKNWILGEIHEGINLKNPKIDVSEFVVEDEIVRQIIFSADIDRIWSGKTSFVATPIWQPSKKVVLEITDQLFSIHRFDCSLGKGCFQFQVIHAGEELLNPPILFFVGIAVEEQKINLEKLRPHLTSSIGQAIPQYVQHDLMELISLEFRKVNKINSQYKYRLLTMPAKNFIKYGRKKIKRLGYELIVIHEAHLGCYSLRKDGLFPAWMVLKTPLLFKFILPKKEITSKVIPLCASYKAKYGKGFTYLKVRGEKAKKDKILILWDVRSKNQYDIEMGIPDVSLKKPYSEFDEYDIWPLRQCEECGEVIVTRRTKADKKIHDLHKHGQQKPKLIDITYEFELIAQISLIKLDEPLSYKEQISEWFDRNWAVQRIKTRSVKNQQKKPENIMSSSGYKYAIDCIITQRSSQGKYRFWQWFSKEKWHLSLKQLEFIILKEKIPIPAYGPARRMLENMQWDGGEKSVNIDKHCFLIALLLRGQAYHRGQTDQVLQLIDLKVEQLVEMLEFIESIAPEMLHWGLAFAEVFYNHAVN